MLLRFQQDMTLAGIEDLGSPFAGLIVAEDHRIARRNPHDLAKIMRLIALDPDVSPFGQGFVDEKARGALGRPGGGGGHGCAPSSHGQGDERRNPTLREGGCEQG